MSEKPEAVRGSCSALPESVQYLDPHFRRSVMDVEAKDKSGRRFKIQHKFGRDAGVWTLPLLMKKHGMWQEMSKASANSRKLYKRDPKGGEAQVSLVESNYRKKMRDMIKAYTKWLTRHFYKDQAIEPILEGIPINRNKDDNEYYIAGFRDADTSTPLVFTSAKQVQLALCKSEKATRAVARKHAKTIKTVKAFSKLACINKDMRHELDLIARGQDIPGLLYTPEAKD